MEKLITWTRKLCEVSYYFLCPFSTFTYFLMKRLPIYWSKFYLFNIPVLYLFNFCKCLNLTPTIFFFKVTYGLVVHSQLMKMPIYLFEKCQLLIWHLPIHLLGIRPFMFDSRHLYIKHSHFYIFNISPMVLYSKNSQFNFSNILTWIIN